MRAVHLDRASRQPLYRQLAGELEQRIRCGELAAGERLPPTRQLVDDLGINRSTAVAAYRLLEEQGLVRSQVGRGTEVVGVASPVRDRLGPSDGLARLLGGLARDLDEEAVGDDPCDFSRLAPDPRFFPVDALRSSLDAVLGEDGADLLQYAPGRGEPALRETIAGRMARIGVERAAEEILVVSGAQQGLDLVLRAFASPGQRVAVEVPTYSGLLPLLRLAGVDVVGVPMTSDGVDLDRLQEVAGDLRLFLTMPTFHNPTAVTTGLGHRHRLVEMARREGFAIVEDGFEDELRFGADVPPPLASLDPDGVLYLGTFSKALFPGIRLGWVAGPVDAVRRLASLKGAVDYGAPPVLQAALDRMCRAGDYDRHLARLADIAAQRRRALERSARRCLAEGCHLRLPPGGWAAWLELPAGLAAETVAREAAASGVLVSPGSRFRPDPSGPSRGLRLSLSRVDEDEIEHGLAVLGRVIRRLAPARRSLDETPERVPLL